MVETAERRIRIVLAYNGTAYAGWQVQPGEITVQGELQGALGRIHGGDRISVRGAGRTDAGVHALGQVADGMVRTVEDDRGLLRALRSILPPDIRPLLLETVDDRFHSRHHAVSKTYAYVLDTSPCGDPFRVNRSLHHPHEFDADAVRETLSRLVGEKDWSGFAGSACPPGNRVRTLTEATLDISTKGIAIFRFTANGFLNHMVRNLVGTVLEVGRGRFSPGRIDKIIRSCDRRLAGPTAPPAGLCLLRVRYENFPDTPLPSSLFGEG